MLLDEELSRVSGGGSKSTVKRCGRFKCRECGAVPYSVKLDSAGSCTKCYVKHKATCKSSFYGYCGICENEGSGCAGA